MAQAILSEEVKEKWAPVLEAEGVSKINDPKIRNIVTRLLENQSLAAVQEAQTTTANGGSDAYGTTGNHIDPVLISLVRRSMPTLVAHDLVGVQPMSGPTGLIFAQKVTGGAPGALAEMYAPGAATVAGEAGTIAAKQATADGEVLGTNKEIQAADNDGTGSTDIAVKQDSPWNEMSFEIVKSSVEAQTRALKASYTHELAQDLQAIHGLDAESELAALLQGEITAEIDRELVGIVTDQAIESLQTSGGTATYRFTPWSVDTAGTFDFGGTLDSDGRWRGDHIRNLIGVINRVAAEIALGTGRGMGNKIITNPVIAAAIDSASALATNEGPLDAMNNNNVGIQYAGKLLGRYDVYVDPYMITNDVVVGYKGANVYDAGYFYCPYVPLTQYKAIGEDDFQPRLGFKTRYGVKHNPLVAGTSGSNWYYRKFTVAGI